MGDLWGFLGRHVFASIIGAFAMISYVLGIAEQAHAVATRFKAWQLQALGGMLFFVSVVMVLASYDKERIPVASIASDNRSPASSQITAPTPPNDISQAYVALMSGDHTELQEQKFLAAHEGKTLELNLELASIDQDGKWLRGQFRAGKNPDVFARFAPEWSDYLANRRVGDPLHFGAKIVKTEGGSYELMEAEPL